jgi:hypothetical protein
MFDSIYPASLPPGADAYLGYVDGSWPDFRAEVARFPGAHVLGMAVTAADDAEGLDVEFRDATPAQAPGWVPRQQARGIRRPVLYASVSRMREVLDAIRGSGIARQDVRLLSAHYGAGRHICGPSTCRYFERRAAGLTPACDGTQWTDQAAGANGTRIDESVLAGDFFDGGNMDLTPANLRDIAKAVWTTDGLVQNPAGSTANPFWEPSHALEDLMAQVRALRAVVPLTPPPTDPAAIAAAIETSLGPDLASAVWDELKARLEATP